MNARDLFPVLVKSRNLYFRRGNSDKVYNIELRKNNRTGLYAVYSFWGRRGSVLREETICIDAAYLWADRAYNDLFNKKRNKGYSDSLPTEVSRQAPVERIPDPVYPEKKVVKEERRLDLEL